MHTLLHHTSVIGVTLLFITQTPARTIEVTPADNWFEWLSGSDLRPGDELVFREGIYSNARRLVVRHSGTQGAAIVIRAADGERVVFQRPDARQNTFNLEGTQFLTLRGFEITGGAAAIRIGPDNTDRQASDVVLEELHIHDVGGVAVTCNYETATYRRMQFRQNHIHHTSGHGEAFYLGANEGKAVFSNSIVENNYIHHLNGPEISQGDGIEIKQGSFGNRISGNIIHDTGYPAITVYGSNGGARNLIYDNIIWNTGDHGIQAAADAIIRNNFIANTGGCGIYSREHQGAVPSHLRIEGNDVRTVKNPAVRIVGGGPEAMNIELLHNTLLGQKGRTCVRIDNLRTLIAEGNEGIGEVQGANLKLAKSSLHSNARRAPPDLTGHPAWKHLQRTAVTAMFP